MKTPWVAAGFAAGYLLGTKAGRERYNQIVAAFNEFKQKPMVVDAQEKAKELATKGKDAVAAKVGLHSTNNDRTTDLTRSTA